MSATPAPSGSPANGATGPSAAGSLPPGLSLPPTAKPTPAAGEQTLSGVVEDGVEGRCLILRDEGGVAYQLLGADPAIVRPGARVVVTGHVATGIMTYCMQGKPFQVSSARPQ